MGDQPALDQPALDFDRQLAETVARVEDELYGVAPAEFVGRRSEAVRSAKENGDRALADAVAALRKPTAAAWTLNAFARDHEPTVEALLELGGRLRAAMERGEGDELRRLARERRGAVAAAIGEVRARATEQGRPLSMSVAGQIEQTLRAALASQTDGERLRRGVLATPLTECGENPLPSIGGTARLRIVGADAPPTDSVPTDSVPTNSVPTEAPKRRDETATKRLARAEETLRDATHALDAAADR